MGAVRFNKQQLLLLEKILDKLDHMSEILDRMQQNPKRTQESLVQWQDEEDEEESTVEVEEAAAVPMEYCLVWEDQAAEEGAKRAMEVEEIVPASSNSQNPTLKLIHNPRLVRHHHIPPPISEPTQIIGHQHHLSALNFQKENTTIFSFFDSDGRRKFLVQKLELENLFNLSVPVHWDPGKELLGVSDGLLAATATMLKLQLASGLPMDAFIKVQNSFETKKSQQTTVDEQSLIPSWLCKLSRVGVVIEHFLSYHFTISKGATSAPQLVVNTSIRSGVKGIFKGLGFCMICDLALSVWGFVGESVIKQRSARELDESTVEMAEEGKNVLTEGVDSDSKSAVTRASQLKRRELDWDDNFGYYIKKKPLAPPLFDVLPLKVIFKPFDRGRERTLVGINSDGQDVMEELGLGSNGGNILKMDRHKHVKVAYHGFRELSKEEKVESYLFARNEDIEDKPKDNLDPCIVAVVQGLEINERLLKHPLLDFENLSISDLSGKEELKTQKVLLQHVETISSSEAIIDVAQSIVEPSSAKASIDNTKGEQRRHTFKKEHERQD